MSVGSISPGRRPTVVVSVGAWLLFPQWVTMAPRGIGSVEKDEKNEKERWRIRRRPATCFSFDGARTVRRPGVR